jgi:ubiquinone/menaquinone biosynthesis C-methylase UbiE
MAAAYDTYDYPSYWEGRNYEHGCEVIAIKAFLTKIPKIKTIVDIGAGFGRLTPSYIFRAKKVILTDPSASILKLARRKYGDNKKVLITQSSVENLTEKVRGSSADLILMVRVLHHINDIDKAFNTVSKLLKKNGYFILEFPNKTHFKSTLHQFFHGNFTYPLDIFSTDRSSLKNRKNHTLPFFNYHPDSVIFKLEEHGFSILEKRSVSNIRSPLLKRIFPTNILLQISNYLQVPLSYINFGPSIFVLARKRG